MRVGGEGGGATVGIGFGFVLPPMKKMKAIVGRRKSKKCCKDTSRQKSFWT